MKDYNGYLHDLVNAGVELEIAKELANKFVTPTAKKIAKKPVQDSFEVYDYKNDPIPNKVRDLIGISLAIEEEDAKKSGNLGFMTRSLAIATLPHRRQKDYKFERINGDFTLTMLTAHPEGLPFGTIPRLLLTWVCTEAVRKQERVLSLGDSLMSYLYELGLNPSGGKRGDITRLKHAMTTLFSTIISCRYEGKDKWILSNVLLADKIEWWQPQTEEHAGKWKSNLQLSEPFFKECLDHPLPIDLRAVRGLSRSPMAIDIYIWLTYRMSYLSRKTTIPWLSLSGQFGASYALNEQGTRDFKRAFLRSLKDVSLIYPEAKFDDSADGLILYPSKTHIPYIPSVKSTSRKFKSKTADLLLSIQDDFFD